MRNSAPRCRGLGASIIFSAGSIILAPALFPDGCHQRLAFPRPSQKAELKVLQGRQGPAFLMIDNFFVLKRYNNADKYALGVGLLADQIAGFPAPRKDWTRPFTKLSIAQSEELQARLARKGYYEGEVDGKIGPMSRSAIKAFQASAGLPQDGFASMEVLEVLRRR